MSMNYEPQGFDDMNWDPITDQSDAGMFSYGSGNLTPVKKSSNSRKVLTLVVVIAVALLVGAGVFASIYFEKGNMVLRAANNTLKENNHLAENVSIMSEIINSGKYTMDFKGEADGQEFRVKFMDVITQKQLKGTVDVEKMEVDFDMYLDQEQFAMRVPVISDKVFTYYYTAVEDNNGYLMQFMSPDDIAMLNETLAGYTSMHVAKEAGEEFLDVFLEEYKDLEFEKAEEREFEVDGTSRQCKGYETTITAATATNFLNAYGELYDIDSMESYENLDVDIKESFSQLKESVADMPDVKTSFYVHDDKLAGIVLATTEATVEIHFLGGDTRMQNMKVVADGETIMEVKGNTEGSVEETLIYVMDEEVYSLQYNYGDGNYTLNVPSYLYAEGNIAADKSEVVFSIDKLEMEDSEIDLTAKCSVTKGGAPVKIGGTVFNIGTASASDYSRLSKDFMNFYEKVYRDVYLQ